jgi:hypothetical protein
MNGDRIVGAVFALIALAFIFGAEALPPSLGNLPGAGFFPFWIGAAMLALSIPLLFRSGQPAAETTAGDWKRTGMVAGLTLAYLLLWGSGFFALRTVVFLAVLLKLLGENWRSSVGVSATLTAVVVAAFQYGLRVNLE